jgi:hypothetical protein
MGWFPGARQIGAWLALVALALQLGLSFGHLHVQPPGHHPPELAAAGTEEPQDTDPDHGDGRNHCPSCAILSLLAGAQTGATPVSAMPEWRAAEEVIPAAETIRSGSIRAAFRARAPPLA